MPGGRQRRTGAFTSLELLAVRMINLPLRWFSKHLVAGYPESHPGNAKGSDCAIPNNDRNAILFLGIPLVESQSGGLLFTCGGRSGTTRFCSMKDKNRPGKSEKGQALVETAIMSVLAVLLLAGMLSLIPLGRARTAATSAALACAEFLSQTLTRFRPAR